MNPFILATLILAGSVAIAESGDVSTSASTNGEVTYFESEDHPMKMDWNNWTFCWGANAKAKTENSRGSEQGSNDNSGSLEAYANVEGPLNRMLANRLQWESKFDKQDMVFRINIQRTLGTYQERQVRSTCATHDWKYKVNKAESKVETSVMLHVPDNVWVMRIKTLVNKSGNLLRLDHSRPMPKKEGYEVQTEEGFLLAGYQYFFTKPGEDFKIALSINEKEVKDIDLVASIEVTFIGQNRCEQTVREVLGNEKAVTSAQIANEVRSAFDRIAGGLNSKNQSSVDSLHRATLFIGCLMNRNISDSILFNNDATQMQKLMTEVQDFREKVNNQLISDPQYKEVGDALKLLTQMSLTSLTSGVLEYVKPFCQKIPIFDASLGKTIGYKRGFVKIGENLKHIRALLGTAGFTKYYADLFTKYQLAMLNAQTYAEVAADPIRRAQLIELGNLFDANNKVLVAHRISALLVELPALKPNATVLALAESAQKMEAVVGLLHSSFSRELDSLSLRSPLKPKHVSFDSDIRELDLATKKFSENLQLLLSLVDKEEGGPMASEFAEATQRILTVGGNRWLANVYGGYFADYLASLDPDFQAARAANAVDTEGNYKQQALEEVTSCLTAYSSLNNR